jgi:hypothetical protein
MLTILLQTAALHILFLGTFFAVASLPAVDLWICIGLGALVWAAVEVEKRLK